MANNKQNEDSLQDIAYITDEKSSKAKKFIFIGLIVAVLGIIGYVVVTTFFTNEKDETQTQSTLDFLEDDGDQFFMDSPVDSMDDENSEVDNLQENDVFNKNALLNEAEQTDTSALISQEPISQSATLERKTEQESISQNTSLMEKENETPIVKTISPEKVSTNESSSNERAYFIQTGTFMRFNPNKKFLKSITDLGLSYSIDIYQNSREQKITRVLVGPFDNKSDANEALLTVREKLVKDAYVLKTRLH